MLTSKKIAAGAISATAVVSLAACSSDEQLDGKYQWDFNANEHETLAEGIDEVFQDDGYSADDVSVGIVLSLEGSACSAEFEFKDRMDPDDKVSETVFCDIDQANKEITFEIDSDSIPLAYEKDNEDLVLTLSEQAEEFLAEFGDSLSGEEELYMDIVDEIFPATFRKIPHS